MPFWEREPFPGLIADGHFSISDYGPLRSPVQSFKLHRTDKLELTLETICGKDAITQGILRDGNDPIDRNRHVVLKSIGRLTVTLGGVISQSIATNEDYRRDTGELRETAYVASIEAQIREKAEPVYTIDLLENIDRRYYFWPIFVKDDGDTDFKRSYGTDADALVLSDKDGRHKSGSAALKLNIAGIELYLTVNEPKEGTQQVRPGYILYRGMPDETTRRKIRTVISYALGIYIVYLGNSTYTADWCLSSLQAFRGYSMDMRAFDLHVMPPAWLGVKSHNVLDVAKVSRLVSGLYAHYDELDFGNLNWGYWHAMCAPMHIRAVHFGAIIEALQRNYLNAHASEFSEKIMGDSAAWAEVSKIIADAIGAMEISTEQKDGLRANLGRLNQSPRATVTDQVFRRLGLELSDEEKLAWKRRHDAAHGNPMTPGGEAEVIRDSQILQVLFNRMVLRAVDGNDHYYDYSAQPSPSFPFRELSEPVQQQSRRT